MSKTRILNEADEDTFFSVSEASSFLSVKESAIRNYLYERKLTTYKFKGLTLLSKREIEGWKGRKRQ